FWCDPDRAAPIRADQPTLMQQSCRLPGSPVTPERAFRIFRIHARLELRKEMTPMSRQLLEREPVAATEDERQALLQLRRALSCQSEQAPKLVGPEGEIALPEGLSRVLRAAIHVMLCRDAVSVVPIHRELTTQEAADLLNISRPSLVRL